MRRNVMLQEGKAPELSEEDRLFLEKRQQEGEPYRDKIRGCLLGGAAGDAGDDEGDRGPSQRLRA